MVSKESCDSEDWSNDAENSVLHQRKKIVLLLFNNFIIFHNFTVFLCNKCIFGCKTCLETVIILQLMLVVQNTSLLYKSNLCRCSELYDEPDWRQGREIRAALHKRAPRGEASSLLEWATQHGSSLLLLTFPVALSAETNSDGTRASRSHFHSGDACTTASSRCEMSSPRRQLSAGWEEGRDFI